MTKLIDRLLRREKPEPEPARPVVPTGSNCPCIYCQESFAVGRQRGLHRSCPHDFEALQFGYERGLAEAEGRVEPEPVRPDPGETSSV